MSRATGFAVFVLLALMALPAFASTGGDRVGSARLLPGSQLSLAMLGDIGQPEQPAQGAVEDHKKSYGVVIPLSFLVGFGSGHFYAGATWRGLRYLAYDLVAIGLDVAMYFLLYDSLDSTVFWAIAGIVLVGNRVFQTIDAAQTVNSYNKGFDVSESNRELVPPALRTAAAPPARMRTLFAF